MERGVSWGDGKGTLNEYIIRRASEHLADSKKKTYGPVRYFMSFLLSGALSSWMSLCWIRH